MGGLRRPTIQGGAIAVVAAFVASPLSGQLGQLPLAPAAIESVRDVRVELSLRFWVDPDLVSELVPRDARLRTVASYSIPDSVIPTQFHDWIDASLIFLSADQIELDGRTLQRDDFGAFKAFWWLKTEGSAGVSDPNTRGDQQAVELASWLVDPWAAQRWAQIGVNAGHADAVLARLPDGWRFSMVANDVEIQGSCEATGAVVVEDYHLPAYSTVAHAGQPSPLFTVFTFQGHESQRCQLTDLDVLGDGILATSLRASMLIQQPTVVLMDSWEARSGIYRRGMR